MTCNVYCITSYFKLRTLVYMSSIICFTKKKQRIQIHINHTQTFQLYIIHFQIIVVKTTIRLDT